MRVEIRLSSDIDEPYAIIHTKELTEEIQQVVMLIENSQGKILTVKQNERLFILNISDVQLIRTEGKEVCVYDSSKQKFTSTKRLYEIEALLNNEFIRISKSAIVNLLKIDHVDTNIVGTLDVVTKNGCVESISRRYVQAFKTRVGI
ncbi:LytTR family DNA-binding domain-containing protein [Granulicatella seriolae]|uniref:LytTR family transcriptional regulator n=1 Tax=Granulicatella seriolae TaxID=2967226 RepID=A0ABT1WNE8_9LACT|nr:LytTR family DNA-binding domain-containing protein [Granulicatella seriolae]